MHLQSHLRSSRLVQLLHGWAQVDCEPPRQDIAERLGEWLGALDSIRLDGALQAISSHAAAAARPGSVVDLGGLMRAVEQTKAELMALFAAKKKHAGTDIRRGRGADAEATEPEASADADYTSHHQRYQALQKQIESKVAQCRAQVRQAVAKGAPGLRQLAALDAAMEQMLGERSQKLLTTVPVYLERRFEHWRHIHRQQAMAASAEDDPALWRQPGGWLHAFEQDMREMLLAEIQVRLQPVLGLVEAAQNENREQA